MQLPALSPDTLIIAALVVGALYGLIGGKFHLRLFILSIYVGLVLAERLTGFAQPYLSSLSQEHISWLLLGVPVLIFSFAPRGHGKHGSHGSAVVNLIVGLLAGALLASSALRVMPVSQQEAFAQGSFLALELARLHLWLLGLLPLAVIIMTFHQPKEKAHH